MDHTPTPTRWTAISWTDGRVVAGLIVVAIALTTLVAGNATSTRAAMSEAADHAPAEPTDDTTADDTPADDTGTTPSDVPDEPVPEPSAPAEPRAEPDEPTATTEIAETGTAAWGRELLDRLDGYDTLPDERYDRDSYDDGWADTDRDCQSARHEVLIQESLEPVEFVGGGSCKVEAGLWIDPYSGEQMTRAAEASIDHVVSLADAHRSGAWRWNERWRRAFSNDLDDPAVLTASATAVNGAKGSAAPDTWMPIDADARCRYAIAWVRVKTRWQLAVTAAERQALAESLDKCVAETLPATPDTTPLVVIDFGDTVNLRPTPTPAIITDGECDDRYSGTCIPPSNDDLDCDDIGPRRFDVETTDDADPHGFDGDDDGIACER